MRRLVLITQRADPGHQALGQVVAQIRALAERVDELVVLAGGAKPDALPSNCRVRSFAAPTQAARGARFVAALAAELRPRPLAVLAHMCPIYAVLAAPLARPVGVPVVLWFTHWRPRAKLRLAERLSTRVLSVSESSFPLPSRKLVPVGHAVDLEAFSCGAGSGDGELRAVSLGRYSPSKRYPDLLAAVRRAREDGVPVTLDVYGPTLTAEERRHRAELDRLRPDGVVLHDGVPGSEVPAVLARYDAFVSGTRAGSADKAILEAAASCLPVIAATPPIPGALEFRDAEELAARLAEVARLTPQERAALGREGRARVEEAHSLDAWADRVVAAL